MREAPAAPPYRVEMPYAVQTPVFDGPFDLLLHLILREQVDLYEISLSAIVDAYLRELTSFESVDLEIATEEPGFARDEAPEALGSALKLPRQHEHLRPQLARSLEPIQGLAGVGQGVGA